MRWALVFCRGTSRHAGCHGTSDEEAAARVRAAVAGDFQPEQVNGFPMKPEEGYYDLVSPSRYQSLLLAFLFSF